MATTSRYLASNSAKSRGEIILETAEYMIFPNSSPTIKPRAYSMVDPLVRRLLSPENVQQQHYKNYIERLTKQAHTYTKTALYCVGTGVKLLGCGCKNSLLSLQAVLIVGFNFHVLL
mmetsp:Transcript_4595/g.6848  ORF Transcript_4595/g.6848 Transcript_4595/m.6848 type:complete len:117 (-) Transcript_4595:229-579(-)